MAVSLTICIVSNSFPPEKGAAPTRIYNLAQLLQKHNYKVHVIASLPNYPTGAVFKGYKGKWKVEEYWDNIPVCRLWVYPTNSGFFVKRVLHTASQSLSFSAAGIAYLNKLRPDLLIVSTPPLFLAGLAAKWAAQKKVSLLTNISDIWPLSASELSSIKPESLAYKRMLLVEKRLYERSSFFSVQSEEIASHIHKQPGQAGKPTFVYRNLQGTGNTTFLTRERVAADFKIVYAGLLGIAQGVLELCKAINFAAIGASLHIYGDGNELEAIRDFVSQNPGRGIYIYPAIPPQEVPQMLQSYAATLIPLKTKIEGAVPSKIFMAVANTIPIFFSGNGEGAQIVAQNNIGWVNNAGDYKQLAENIRRAQQLSREEYVQMQRNAFALSQGAFNKEEQDRRFIKFLEQILS